METVSLFVLVLMAGTSTRREEREEGEKEGGAIAAEGGRKEREGSTENACIQLTVAMVLCRDVIREPFCHNTIIKCAVY